MLSIQVLLCDIDYSSAHTPMLWCDNVSAIYLSTNPMFHARNKHIKIDYHFTRDMVVKKQLHILYISSEDQLIDILTKSLFSIR